MIKRNWKFIFVAHPIRPEDIEIEEMKTKARHEVERAYNIEDTSIIDIDYNEIKEKIEDIEDKLYKDICSLERILCLLSISDIVYFPIGWENYKICKVIHYICDTYKFPYIHVKDGHTSYHLFDKENAK